MPPFLPPTMGGRGSPVLCRSPLRHSLSPLTSRSSSAGESCLAVALINAPASSSQPSPGLSPGPPATGCLSLGQFLPLPHQASQGSKEDSGQFPSGQLSSKNDWPGGGRKVSFVPVLYLAVGSQVSGHGTGGLLGALFGIFLQVSLPQIPRVKSRQGAQNSPPQIAALRSAL